MSVICISPTLLLAKGLDKHVITVRRYKTGQKLIEASFATSEYPQSMHPIVSGQAAYRKFTASFHIGSGNLNSLPTMQKPSGGQSGSLFQGDYDLRWQATRQFGTMDLVGRKGTFEMICYGTATQLAKGTILTLVQLSVC